MTHHTHVNVATLRCYNASFVPRLPYFSMLHTKGLGMFRELLYVHVKWCQSECQYPLSTVIHIHVVNYQIYDPRQQVNTIKLQIHK